VLEARLRGALQVPIRTRVIPAELVERPPSGRPLKNQLLRGLAYGSGLAIILIGFLVVRALISHSEHQQAIAQQQQAEAQSEYAAQGLREECHRSVTLGCASQAARDTATQVAWIAKTPRGFTAGGLVVTIGTKYHAADPAATGYADFAADTGFADRGLVHNVDLLTAPTGITVSSRFPIMTTVTVGGDSVVIRQVGPHSLWAQWTHKGVVYVMDNWDETGLPPLELTQGLLTQVRYTST